MEDQKLESLFSYSSEVTSPQKHREDRVLPVTCETKLAETSRIDAPVTISVTQPELSTHEVCHSQMLNIMEVHPAHDVD